MTPATTALRHGRAGIAIAAGLAAALATAGLFAGPAFAQSSAPAGSGLSVLLCPTVRPLAFAFNDGTSFTTLAIPRVAVVNGADADVDVSEVRAELLWRGRVMATRELTGASIGATAGHGACNARAAGRPTDLAAPAQVQPHQAVLLTGQVFGWTGQRDALRIVVHSRRDGEDHREATTIPLATPTPAA